MIKKGTILICNKEISDTTIGKEYLVIKDDTIEDDDGYERYMKHHVEDGTFSVKSLKIGDTFEYNGFICEVKEKIEEKNWYRIIDRIGNLYFEKMPKERAERAVDYEVKSITEITNKEFIKQLEENAR